MKFVHIADMHFDCPFTSLAQIDGLAEKRRIEQRNVFKKIIEYIKENNIELFFISGDLYEHEYIRKTTIDYINNLFKEIPETRIFITPGNHDPYIKNSYYMEYNWNENVKIFDGKIEKINYKNINIYGFGFEDFYCTDSKIEEIQLDEKNKINILITHANLDGNKNIDEQYNSINLNKLKSIGFDYIALGHVHKNNIDEKNKIIYPGSTISHGFDELGKHGMVVGDINEDNKNINIRLIPLDENEFEEKNINIEELNSEEEVIEKINNLKLNKNNYYKIILNGKIDYLIDEQKIKKIINSENILKIKNKTEIKIDLEKIAEEESLKGYFIKDMLEKLEETENKEIIKNALEIGLDALKG